MTEKKGQDRLDRLEKLAEEMFAGIARLRESQAKTDEQLNRTDEQIRELKASQAKTDEQLSRTDEQLSRTIKKLDDIGRQLGDMGLVQGEVARSGGGIILPEPERCLPQDKDGPEEGETEPQAER